MLSVKRTFVKSNAAQKRRSRSFCIAIIAFCGPILPLQAMSAIEEQRQNYEKAMTAIEGKEMSTFKKLKSTLENYPLYPYLDYRELSQQLDTATLQQVGAFEQQYAELPFINTVRGRYLQKLADDNNWSDFLVYQKKPPVGENYRCNYYFAHSKVGDKKLALSGAKSLYLQGNSIDKACDKLFLFLKNSGQLNNDLIIERMLLAFDNGQTGLLTYLQKQLTANAVKQGEQILSLYKNSKGVADFSKKMKVTSNNQHLTRLAFELLVKKNANEAVSQFDVITEGSLFTPEERQKLADFLISRLMSTEDADLAAWRDKWLETSLNQSLLERRFRVALVSNDWPEIERWLNVMPKEEAESLTWRYWRARVALQKGEKDIADGIFTSMIGKRHFYSVAAAMHLNKEIEVPHQTTALNTDNIEPFSASLTRIQELVTLNKTIDSRREWHHLLNRVSPSQQEMLAAYALEKKWFHLSVQATIMGKLWEHLDSRFPVAHRWWFEFFSKERGLPLTTLLALSRQESAFFTNAVSPVGARGLMQLMPATAKETSKKLGVKYLGNNTLDDPGTNIQLGSGYLRMLLDSFEENRILAFAAYNAGPRRVQTWLDKSKGNLDVIGFIEAIPFHETRGYVQNVLMYEIYYSKLLGMPMQFLKEGETARSY